MNRKDTTLTLIRSQGTLPLFYHDSEEISIKIVKTLRIGGGRFFEFTNLGSNALETFTALRKLVDNEYPGKELGMGTIRSEKDVEAFIKAGEEALTKNVLQKVH